jgi:uncharacterized membrane protein
MYYEKNVFEQLVSGFVWVLIVTVALLVLPYKLLRWFVIATTKETGNRIVKFFGSMFATLLVLYVVQLFVQFY